MLLKPPSDLTKNKTKVLKLIRKVDGVLEELTGLKSDYAQDDKLVEKAF